MWEETVPERMRFSRGRHIQTYEGASAAGVGVGMHSPHGPRQSPRHPPPRRARHTLTTRKPHAHAAPKHDASSVWSPRPRTKLTPLTPPTSSAVLRGRACSPPSPPPCVCPAPPPPTAGGRRVLFASIVLLHQPDQLLLPLSQILPPHNTLLRLGPADRHTYHDARTLVDPGTHALHSR